MSQTVIRWKLAEIMARHRIKGKDLADSLSISGNAVSSLKNSQSMPKIDGERLNQICNSLSKLAGEVVSPNNLIEYTFDEEY